MDPHEALRQAVASLPDGLGEGVGDYWDRPQDCPVGPHEMRGPTGPCEDIGQCPKCFTPIPAMRPDGETFGLHADDCSLPERHWGECVGGGQGHPVGHVRGYFGPEFEAKYQR